MPNPVTKMPAPVTPEMAGTPENRAEVLLQPIAAPSILGLYGFAAATFMVAAHIAHWYGSSNTELYLAPFAAVFGGLAQFPGSVPRRQPRKARV
jgi:succinate-acetate transporter protein